MITRPIKTFDYIIVLNYPAKFFKAIDIISQLMLAIAAVAFILRGVVLFQNGHSGGIYTINFLIPIFIFSWWIWCYRQQSRGIMPYYRFALMLAAWGWYLYPKGLLFAILYLIAAVLEKPAKVLPEVAFDKKEIVFNSIPSKKFKWEQVNNVVLKDNILTIDLKNNQLIQKTVKAEVTPEQEKEFNAFCAEQINNTKAGN
jgi:hypothetical protein